MKPGWLWQAETDQTAVTVRSVSIIAEIVFAPHNFCLIAKADDLSRSLAPLGRGQQSKGSGLTV
jgi:hypothetical protein